MHLKQNPLNTQKWWAAPDPSLKALGLCPRGVWVQSHTGAEELMGQAACREKDCYLVEMGRVPSNYMKEGQM